MIYNIPERRKYGPRKIFVAIPSRTDAVKVQTMIAILDAEKEAAGRGWNFFIKGYAGVEPISDCRNLIVAEFLASDCDDLFFWDDDVVPEKGAMVRVLDHPVEFVIGVYPFRGDPLGFPVRILRDKIECDPDNGLLEVNGGGFGFARVTRRCVEEMVKAYPRLKYTYLGCPNDSAAMLFQLNVLTDGGWQMSEDMIFAKRWQDIGGKMWCDTEITFAHIGNKGFVGHYGDWLRQITIAQQKLLTEKSAEKENGHGVDGNEERHAAFADIDGPPDGRRHRNRHHRDGRRKPGNGVSAHAQLQRHRDVRDEQ